jgi:hypothetical protein
LRALLEREAKKREDELSEVKREAEIAAREREMEVEKRAKRDAEEVKWLQA